MSIVTDIDWTDTNEAQNLQEEENVFAPRSQSINWLDAETAEEFYKKASNGLGPLMTPRGYQAIADDALTWFTGTEIIFSEGVEYIGQGACKGLKHLQSVSFPSTLVVIDEAAFEDCERLDCIELPIGLREINWRAFARCYSLREVTIPGTVSVVGESAFEECINLRRLTIDEGVQFLEDCSFGYCPNLFWFGKKNLPSTINANNSLFWRAFKGSPCLLSPIPRFFRWLKHTNYAVGYFDDEDDVDYE